MTKKIIREIILETETTGLYLEKGDKLVEIGAIELINRKPTGRMFHYYINPEREVPEEVVKVHGLTYDFLKKYPTFNEIAPNFLDFIGKNSKIVAQNAVFDMKFINHELEVAGYKKIRKNKVIDTLEIAKAKFPGQRNNLDALCKRFHIDYFDRRLTGTLLDAELLSEVYPKLLNI